MSIFAILQVFVAIVAIAYGLAMLIRTMRLDSAEHFLTIAFAAIAAAGCTVLIRFFVTL